MREIKVKYKIYIVMSKKEPVLENPSEFYCFDEMITRNVLPSGHDHQL